MKRMLPIFVFLLWLVFSFNFAYAESEVYTEVHTEATGDNASVHTEITNIVNDKEVKVESNEQGEIKVEVKDGEVEVESIEASPTVTVKEISEEEREEEKKQVIDQIKEIHKRILESIRNFFSFFPLRLTDWLK